MAAGGTRRRLEKRRGRDDGEEGKGASRRRTTVTGASSVPSKWASCGSRADGNGGAATAEVTAKGDSQARLEEVTGGPAIWTSSTATLCIIAIVLLPARNGGDHPIDALERGLFCAREIDAFRLEVDILTVDDGSEGEEVKRGSCYLLQSTGSCKLADLGSRQPWRAAHEAKCLNAGNAAA